MDLQGEVLHKIPSTVTDNSDLTVLRRQLLLISQKHYQALWADHGPMWQALRGKFSGQQQFENLRPDIKAIHQPDAENSEDYQAFTKRSDFEAEKYRLTAFAMDLRKDKKTPIFAYQVLGKIYAGQVDDFSLFNEAYGLAFTALTNSSEEFNMHYTPYHVHNGVITTINKALELEAHKDNPASNRWKALVTLTSATTTLNKDINPDRADNTYPINSITTIYSWLENLREPLHHLKSADCKALTDHVQSFYEESHEEVFKYLYFKKDQQRALAKYFGFSLPAKGLNYREFLAKFDEVGIQQNLAPHKQGLATAIYKFAHGELNHIGFQAEVIKLRHQRPSSFLDRFANYIIAIFTPGRGKFSALYKLYNDTFFVENNIHPQFKKVREAHRRELAREEVNSEHPSTTYTSVLSRLSGEQKLLAPKPTPALNKNTQDAETKSKPKTQTASAISKEQLTQALIEVRKQQSKALVKAHLQKEIEAPTKQVISVY